MKETSRTEQVPKHRTTRPTSWLKVLDVEERESSIRKHQGEEKGGKKRKKTFLLGDPSRPSTSGDVTVYVISHASPFLFWRKRRARRRR